MVQAPPDKFPLLIANSFHRERRARFRNHWPFNPQGEHTMKNLKQQTKATESAPDWVFSTPEESEYELEMFNNGGDTDESITISRDEYIAAKHLIAKMRGYDLTLSEEVRKHISGSREITRAPIPPTTPKAGAKQGKAA
jgi:hypothetical protein